MRGVGCYLLVEELGEEALGLDGGDIAAEIAPDEDAALDVQQEQRRHRARHRRAARWDLSRLPDLDRPAYSRPTDTRAGSCGRARRARRIPAVRGVYADRGRGAGIVGVVGNGGGDEGQPGRVPVRMVFRSTAR